MQDAKTIQVRIMCGYAQDKKPHKNIISIAKKRNI